MPRDELESETLYLARRIALMPTVALQTTKEALNFTLDQMGQRDALEYHFALHQLVHRSKEGQEWHEIAAEIQDEGGFSAWLEFRDGPFRELAEEYNKLNPNIS